LHVASKIGVVWKPGIECHVVYYDKDIFDLCHWIRSELLYMMEIFVLTESIVVAHVEMCGGTLLVSFVLKLLMLYTNSVVNFFELDGDN
jgi:hypothetical protein